MQRRAPPKLGLHEHSHSYSHAHVRHACTHARTGPHTTHTHTHTYYIGTMDYFTSSPIFRLPNFDAIYTYTVDNYESNALCITTDNEDSLISGDRICRRDPLSKDFSIIAKFKVEQDQHAFSLIKMESSEGVEFGVDLDLCSERQSVTVHFSPECSLPVVIPVRALLRKETWHKLAISVSQRHIALYLDCKLVSLTEVQLGHCSIQCNEDVNITTITAAANSSCAAPESPPSVSAGHKLKPELRAGHGCDSTWWHSARSLHPLHCRSV